MTDKEKARKHLEKQNKRLRMLLRPVWIWTAIILAGIAIMLTLWLMQRAVEPRGPITIQFGSCVAEKTFGYRTLSGEHGVLYAQSGKRYVLYSTVSYREMIQDQADGLLRPGDMLTVMWYPWWEDSIAAVSSQTKEYGSMEAFENGVRDVKPIFYSVSILVGLWLVFCLLCFWSFHSEFSEIRSLRRKYLEQIKEHNSGVSP